MTASNAKIVVMSCNWNGWSCIETAIASGNTYPPSVRTVRVTCLSRIHAGLLLKAFEYGAEGVMLLGCGEEECHFNSDNSLIVKELEKAQSIMAMLGIRRERLGLVQLPAFDGDQFVARLNRFIDEIENVPRGRRTRAAASGISGEAV
jgi:F420-non-reducing hydrogenase iron-sulfur subunit